MKYFMRVKQKCRLVQVCKFYCENGEDRKCFRGIWGTNGKEVCGIEWGRKEKCQKFGNVGKLFRFLLKNS
jgi:hypothetical protein